MTCNKLEYKHILFRIPIFEEETKKISIMHPLGQNGYNSYSMDPTSPHSNGNGLDDSGDGSKYSDINAILDQILNITDQSLDEAQVWYKPSYL